MKIDVTQVKKKKNKMYFVSQKYKIAQYQNKSLKKMYTRRTENENIFFNSQILKMFRIVKLQFSQLPGKIFCYIHISCQEKIQFFS